MPSQFRSRRRDKLPLGGPGGHRGILASGTHAGNPRARAHKTGRAWKPGQQISDRTVVKLPGIHPRNQSSSPFSRRTGRGSTIFLCSAISLRPSPNANAINCVK